MVTIHSLKAKCPLPISGKVPDFQPVFSKPGRGKYTTYEQFKHKRNCLARIPETEDTALQSAARSLSKKLKCRPNQAEILHLLHPVQHVTSGKHIDLLEDHLAVRPLPSDLQRKNILPGDPIEASLGEYKWIENRTDLDELERKKQEQLKEAKLITKQFYPGQWKAQIDYPSGKVLAIFSGGQADILGVKEGWVVHTINKQPYTERTLRTKKDGSVKYSVSFDAPGERKMAQRNMNTTDWFAPESTEIHEPVEVSDVDMVGGRESRQSSVSSDQFGNADEFTSQVSLVVGYLNDIRSHSFNELKQQKDEWLRTLLQAIEFPIFVTDAVINAAYEIFFAEELLVKREPELLNPGAPTFKVGCIIEAIKQFHTYEDIPRTLEIGQQFTVHEIDEDGDVWINTLANEWVDEEIIFKKHLRDFRIIQDTAVQSAARSLSKKLKRRPNQADVLHLLHPVQPVTSGKHIDLLEDHLAVRPLPSDLKRKNILPGVPIDANLGEYKWIENKTDLDELERKKQEQLKEAENNVEYEPGKYKVLVHQLLLHQLQSVVSAPITILSKDQIVNIVEIYKEQNRIRGKVDTGGWVTLHNLQLDSARVQLMSKLSGVWHRVCLNMIVRKDVNMDSERLRILPMGSKVFVVEHRDRRVRIDQPISGWCSARSSNGDTILTPLEEPLVKREPEVLTPQFTEYRVTRQCLVKDSSGKSKRELRAGAVVLVDRRTRKRVTRRSVLSDEIWEVHIVKPVDGYVKMQNFKGEVILEKHRRTM